ncbi:MAG: uncharacterized protein JWP89_1223 [Schlesneria sp.]|nr:uncharacterized protein [Schlesneria sp.]
MPAKKAPSAPPSPETLERVLAVVQSTAEPMTAGQLSKLLVVTPKLTESKLTPVLDEFVASSRLRRFAGKTPKGKPRYWDRGANELGQSLITAAIAKKGPQARSALRTAAKQVPDETFDGAMKSLLETGAIFEHPPLLKKKELFGTTPPSPGPYLTAIGTQLSKVVDQLLAAKVSQSEVRRSLLELVEATGISVFSGATGHEAASPAPVADVDLLALMKRIEPAAENGALVPARDLRRAANLEKTRFDHAVLDLARQGRVMLHRHDFAAGLSEADRDELVADGRGTYYVGMALRRGSAD